MKQSDYFFNKIENINLRLIKIIPKSNNIKIRVIKDMFVINSGLFNSYFFLLKNNFFYSAHILFRTIFERSLFLEFILLNKYDINKRTHLFYYSSRLRNLLWISKLMDNDRCIYYLLNDNIINSDDLCLINNLIKKRISKEQKLFKNEVYNAHYCNICDFKHDERKKVWYRTNKNIFYDSVTINNLSDLSNYIFDHNNKINYSFFYGLSSVYTHGFYVDNWDALNSIPKINDMCLYTNLVLYLCFRNIQLICCNLLDNIDKDLSNKVLSLEKEMDIFLNNYDKKNYSDFKLKIPSKNFTNNFKMKYFKEQVINLYNSYYFLRKYDRNEAAKIISRTIFQSSLNLKYIIDFPYKRERFKLFCLSSRLQIIFNILKVASDDKKLYLNSIKNNLLNEYDFTGIKFVQFKIINLDKKRQKWFLIDKEKFSKLNMTVSSLRELSSLVFPKMSDLYYTYMYGFNSVYSHGIDLNSTIYFLNYKYNKIIKSISNIKILDKLISNLFNEINI